MIRYNLFYFILYSFFISNLIRKYIYINTAAAAAAAAAAAGSQVIIKQRLITHTQPYYILLPSQLSMCVILIIYTCLGRSGQKCRARQVYSPRRCFPKPLVITITTAIICIGRLQYLIQLVYQRMTVVVIIFFIG